MIADAGSLETVDRHRKRVAMKHPWKCGRAEARKGRIHPNENMQQKDSTTILFSEVVVNGLQQLTKTQRREQQQHLTSLLIRIWRTRSKV